MHDLIREMGREIVREQNIKNPGKRSHLWDPNDIAHVLGNDKVRNFQKISIIMPFFKFKFNLLVKYTITKYGKP